MTDFITVSSSILDVGFFVVFAYPRRPDDAISAKIFEEIKMDGISSLFLVWLDSNDEHRQKMPAKQNRKNLKKEERGRASFDASSSR